MCTHVCMSNVYMLPYKYIIACTLCGYSYILTLKANPTKTRVRANQTGALVWRLGTSEAQRCFDWLPATSQRPSIHLRDYRENKWIEHVTARCWHGNIPLGFYLLSIVRPRGTSRCKVPQKSCEQTFGSIAFSLNFGWVGSLLAEWWQIKRE